MRLKKFYKTEAEFEKFHARLKLYPCPHCNCIGYLILHGKLYGFTENDMDDKVQRGHRIFCSNKNRKNGCGRTFSMLMSIFIKHYTVSAKTLSNFLDNIKNGKSNAQANRDAGSKMKGSTVYRIFKRFVFCQARIRTLLSRVKPPPHPVHVKNAVIQTIMHLWAVFAGDTCPVSQFQYQFQASFL